MKTPALAILTTVLLLFGRFAAWAQLVGPGSALVLGSGPYGMVPYDAALTPPQFTFEAWVYVTSQSCNTILSKGDGNNGAFTDYIFQVGTDGTSCGVMRVALFAGGAWDSSTNTVSLNTWTHVAVTFDGVNKVFYINGVKDQTASRPNAIYSSFSPMYIGRQGAICNCNYFQGMLDEVRVWNTALTQTQIQQTMNQALTGTEPNLLAYYKMDESSGTTLSNSAATGPIYNADMGSGASWAISGAQFIPDVFGSNTVATATTATLSGAVNPGNLPTTASFFWGITNNGFDATAVTNLPATNATLAISVPENVTPGQTYNYYIIAQNSAGTATGPVQGFVAAGAHLTTTNVEPSAADWSAPIWKVNSPGMATNNGAAYQPLAGDTCETVYNGIQTYGNATTNTRVRIQGHGVITFPADSLTLNTNTELRIKSTGGGSTGNTNALNSLNFPGVLGNPGLILNGGVLNAGEDGVFPITGKILVSNRSYICNGQAGGGGGVATNRAFNISGLLTGTGDIVILNAGTNLPQQVSGLSNTYSGQWILQCGWLQGVASNALGTNSIIVDPLYAGYAADMPLVISPAGPTRFEVNYNINSAGTLTLTNGGVMLLHQDCAFASVVIEGTALATGTHPYPELAARFPGNFAPGGWGSITVRPYNAAVPPPVTLNLSSGAGSITLNWSLGTLLQATNLSGPWVTNNAPSPYIFAPVGPQEFFRVQTQ
jgi:hypothetical protein